MDALLFSTVLSNDVEALVALVNSAYRGDSSKAGWTTEADLLDGIRTDEKSITDFINEPHSVILKCTNEKNELVGCVSLQSHENKMHLGMLTVSPLIQTQGIGKAILNASDNYAKEQGCNVITITVISVRNELIQWYERRGYKQTGERKPFPEDPRFGSPKQPLEFVMMEKGLVKELQEKQSKV